jgi:hypothetical protein
MSEELKLKFRALGLLSASVIGGEACKDCPHNIPRMSAALLTGDGEALRDCAKLLFKDCELLPLGTKARIAELEAERDRLRDALNLIGTKADFCADECEYGPDATSFRLIADDAKRALKQGVKSAKS